MPDTGSQTVRPAGPIAQSFGKSTLLAAIAGCAMALLAALLLHNNNAPRTEPTAALEHAELQRTELVARLRLAERVLRSMATELARHGQEGFVVGTTEQRTFDAISVTSAGASVLALHGPPAAWPVLEDPLPGKLALGETVVLAARLDSASSAPVLLVRGLAGADPSGRMLVAELAPGYLWGMAGAPPGSAGYCVRDQAGAVLHCSSTQVREAVRSLGPELPATPGLLGWQVGTETVQGAFAWLELAAPFVNGRWVALTLAQPPSDMPLDGAVVAALASAALFGAAALLLLWRTRRPGVPPALSTAPAAAAVTTNAANTSLKLDRQRLTIRAMADIDRAMLSGANAQRMVELVAGHMLACTECDVLQIGLLDRAMASRMTVVLALKGSDEMTWEQQPVDASTRQLLAIPPDGTWLGRLPDSPALEAQVRHGAQSALVLPIYTDGNPVGLISLGYGDLGAAGMSSDEAGNARALAGQLGAALTSAAREAALQARINFDATTSLPNWQYLKEHLGQHMNRARRDKLRLALLFLDLDGFKKVNRSQGHSQGDLVLAQAARRMRECVREEDLVTRFGGDEFVIVLPRIAEGVHARRVADKLIAAMSEPFEVDGEHHHLGCSIGISVFPDDAQTTDTMLRSADSALFDAKSAGRGRYAFFDAGVNQAAVARTGLENELRRALANDEFVVYYQPQINLATGEIEGAEALVRWRHPEQGLVSPGYFIEVAEQAGLITQIGEHVMRTACAQFQEWDARLIAPRRISVNVSGLEIVRTDIVGRVEGVLKDTGLRPLHLELEITEGTFLDGSGRSLDKLNQLQRIGVRIAVDDFGTGYSSLSYLRRLPIDVVKIDQSFVHELVSDRDSRSIARAILKVAHSLGKTVVAEGIETAEQLELLAGWNCDVGQGYFWSPPMDARAFEEFCLQWRESRSPQALTP